MDGEDGVGVCVVLKASRAAPEKRKRRRKPCVKKTADGDIEPVGVLIHWELELPAPHSRCISTQPAQPSRPQASSASDVSLPESK
ncbi:uncharacterized protein LOC144063798 isoform X3 [Vanacampus margaritifer]